MAAVFGVHVVRDVLRVTRMRDGGLIEHALVMLMRAGRLMSPSD
jgi:hypothetical protein